MDKVDRDLNFYKLIQSELSFSGFSSGTVLNWLSKDYPISQADNILKSKLRYEEIDDNDDVSIQLDLSGSESIVFFKYSDPNHIYKANLPELKADKRFNDYLVSLMLQEFLFPKYAYNLVSWTRIHNEDRIVMRQEICDLPPCQFSQIKRNMINAGWEYIDNYKAFLGNYEGFDILIEDLNESNARINGSDVEAFDPRLKLL